MAKVVALGDKVLPESLHPAADTNGSSHEKENDLDRPTHDEVKNVLTIDLDNVSTSLKGRTDMMELTSNKQLLPSQGSPDNARWPQTQNDSNSAYAKAVEKTLQITNVISLASETDEPYINDRFKAEQLKKAQLTKPLVSSFVDKCHRFGRRSTDQLCHDVSEETHNTELHDIYNLDKMQPVFGGKQTPFFTENNAHLVMTFNRPSRNTFNSHTGSSSENGYKEQSFPSKLDTDQYSQFENDQYKNIEFSAIFSSLGDYSSFQDSLDESLPLNDQSLPPNEPLPWGQTYSEPQNNLIIDLDNQNGIDSESFVTLKSESITARDAQRDYSEKGTFGMDYEELFEANKLAKMDCRDLEWHNYFYPNHSETTELNQQYFGYKKQSHSYPTHLLKRAPYPPATAMNPNSTYNSNIFEKSIQDHFPYDHYTGDGYEPYPIEQFYNHPSQENHTVSSSDWNNWVNTRNSLSDIYTATNTSIQHLESPSWATPSPSIRNDTMSPEIVSISQSQPGTDDEETDDADEINNLSVTFCPTKTEITSSISMSPRSLTASPMSTSTPVSTLSQESQSLEDFSTCQWTVSLGCVNKASSQSKNLIIPHCKLSTEQLESRLYTYGIEHNVKRPYPSMADVMRRNRLAAKSAFLRNSATDNGTAIRRRCGRPRKNQIQSAKITTSTSKGTKTNVKAKLDSKSWELHRFKAEASADDDYSEAGSNSRNNRHNEPLNQKAVYIMSKWYEENINNPYPSKADKEEMAQKGGITENQVKSWFANKRNRTNNTKPKVQKRAMEQKLRELFKDLKHNNENPSADNSHIIQQLSGILQQCHAKKTD